jgi:clan AA aspartic protease (TIGR02281 family)
MTETPVADSCKDSRLRLERRLADAGGREECCRIYKSGFNEFARKILPELNGAAEKSGQNTLDYLHTRQIVVDHLTWLTSTCRCTCPDFVNCVQFFTRLDKGCKDRQLAKEIKKLGDWVHAEKAENKIGEKKRADLRARSESQLLFGIGMVGLFLLSIAVFAWQQLSHPTSVPIVAAQRQSSPEVTARTQIEPQVAPPTVSTAVASPQPQAMPQKTTSSVDGIYRFTDAQGVIHFVASLNQVPVEYRSQMNFTQTQPLHTAVRIRGGRVLVPVELFNGHTVVRTHLLLDTGATITTISENLAARLGIGAQQTWPSTARVADGRIVPTRLASLNRLDVGRKSQQNAMVSILSGSGDGGESEGLLGMSFMQHFRYELDFENAVIRWKD